MAIQTDYGKRTINEMVLLFQHGQINLRPGFQRKSVWSDMDRRRLVQSIISEYPLPNISLYCRSSRGKAVYDVIDGKQRLETILMFMGVGRFKRDRFEAKLDLDVDGLQRWGWKTIRRYLPDTRHRFECYPLQTVEVSGDLSEIVDPFVRINSTGKRLTSGKKRHARFYDCRFLKEAERLVRKRERYLRQQRILSSAQLDRVKGTELFCELLMSIHQGGRINKKTSLDRAMGNDAVNGNTLARVRIAEIDSISGFVCERSPMKLSEVGFRQQPVDTGRAAHAVRGATMTYALRLLPAVIPDLGEVRAIAKHLHASGKRWQGEIVRLAGGIRVREPQETPRLEDRRLLVAFVNGVEKIYDCNQLLHLEMFQSLRNEAFSKSVKVDAGGYGVSWNDDVDLSECELWVNGKEPALAGE